MRDIKFRAWHKINEEDEKEVMDYDILLHLAGRYRLNVILKGLNLMQYTGLKDSTGREIYEGDIYTRPCLGEECELKKHSMLIEDMISFYTNDFLELDMGGLSIESDIQVIGNKYENPDLLQG